MINLILLWLVMAAALVGLSQYLPGIYVANFSTALLAGVVMGVLNSLIKPLAQLITLPITLLTLGLFSFVLNALLFWLAAILVSGFSVTGFIPALIGSIVLAIVHGLFTLIFDH